MKKTIPLILTFTILLSMLPCFAFAEDTSGAYNALVDIIDKYGNPHGNLIVEKDGYAVYTLGYYNNRISLEIETESVEYTTYFSKTTNGTFDWKFYGFRSDLDSTYFVNGTISAADDINSDVTITKGNYSDDILKDVATDVKKMRTLTMIFLREMFIMGNVEYDFDDFGFNPDYFKAVQCDTHRFADYFYRFDATLENDGTRTSVCQDCCDTNTITAYGSMGGTPNSKFLAFTALANGLKNSQTIDSDGNPAVIKKENGEKCSIVYNKGSMWEKENVEIIVERINDSFSVTIPNTLNCCYKWSYTSGVGTFKGVTYFADVKDTPAHIMYSTADDGADMENVSDSVTLLRTKSISYLKDILLEFGIDREFYEYGFNKDYFEKTDTPVSQPLLPDLAVFEALKTVAMETGELTNDGYRVLAETSELDFTLLYPLGDTHEFVIKVYKSIDYTFTMHVSADSFGFNRCNIEVWNSELETTSATTVTTVYDTHSIPPTLTDFQPSTSTDKVNALEKADEARSEAIAFLQLLIEINGIDAHFSDFGFNELYFCPQGHGFSEYEYNNDATDTLDGTKTALCLKCHKKDTVIAEGTKLVKIVDTSKIFTDVKSGKWYKNAIDYCYSHGFIAGMEDTRFGLDDPVTRGMFITILARIAGVDTAGSANKVTTKFSDVKSGKYYTAAIKWGVECGIVSGMSKTEFAPNDNITREQICVMIVNFAQFCGINIDEVVTPASFTDSSKIASWAKTAVTVCQKAEIITGYEENGRMYFKPKNIAKRSEAAQILYKFHSEFVNIY